MTTTSGNRRVRPARLRYVPDSSLRIHRVGKAGAFRYLLDQHVLQNPRVLKRIQSLAIPPAWKDVRICVQANGHLQAIGRDARGRKQYRYHAEWRRVRDRQKYAHLLAFGLALPRIRKKVQRHLRQPRLTKTTVLAALVRLLEVSRIRVGNEEYARNNRSFGLTTLRNRHVHVLGANLRFKYRGKSGKHHSVELSDAGLARIVARCQEIPGEELFQYLDENGHRSKIRSGDVNQYLREISGEDLTAKDFRTWGGTVMMAKALQVWSHRNPGGPARVNLDRAVRTVAEGLGNTPAICRKSYVHPAVIDTYLSKGRLPSTEKKSRRRRSRSSGGLRGEEAAVIRLLQGGSRRGSAPA